MCSPSSLGYRIGRTTVVVRVGFVSATSRTASVSDPAGRVSRTRLWRSAPPPPATRSLIEGIKTALLAILVYLVALPFLLFAGFGAVIFFLATAYLLGREYFELAAMRFRPPAEAKAFRKANQSSVFSAGLLIAAFVSIPIVNLATPLFGMAMMVHLHKRLSGRRPSPIGVTRSEALPGRRPGERAPHQ